MPFPSTATYAGKSVGADWHRWDLHVHTPASYTQEYGQGTLPATWRKYVDALGNLPPEIRAIGVNDYFTIDGYRTVLQAQVDGKLPNLALILPVVELRLDTFVGNETLKTINLHVVFSNEVSPDEIDRWFLQQLIVKRQPNGTELTVCLGNPTDLIALGQAIIEVTPKPTGRHPLHVGFANASLPLRTILDALDHQIFRDRYLIAVGLGEWQQMRWGGAGTGLKRDVINRAHMVFTAAPSVAKYHEHRAKLVADNVCSRLIDASDAHYFADAKEPNRLGQSNCWIKADLTFQGLRRAVLRFDDRVFVGTSPPKLERIRENRTKYIRSIEIRRAVDATIDEQWFDCHLDLSADLVAIIGNQGSGKSALTDVIALCADTDIAPDDFSFLTPHKFCDARHKRAAQFTATLTWCTNDTVTRSLDYRRNPTDTPHVRYVPQGFFDKITNETIADHGSAFHREIQKVIFSHVPPHDRLNCTNLDELIAALTHTAQTEIERLRQRLSDLNRRIASLEERASPRQLRLLESRVQTKEAEIAALVANPLAPVSEPVADTADHQTIDELRDREAELEKQIAQVEANRARLTEQRLIVEAAQQKISSAARDLRTTIDDARRELDAVGLTIDLTTCVAVSLDIAPFESALASINGQRAAADQLMNPTVADSLTARLKTAQSERDSRVHRLEQESAAYQTYRTTQIDWAQRLAALRGDVNIPAPDSLSGLKTQLQELNEAAPIQLGELRAERNTTCRTIFEALSGLARQHADVARPVQTHIASDDLMRDRYHLSFNVALRQSGLDTRLFRLIKQTAGRFAGVEEGAQRLRQMLAEADFESAGGATAFAELLLDTLAYHRNVDPPIAVDLQSALKSGATVRELYDLIFGFDYLRPSYLLALNDRPLSRLSPGERGILLLVFYLCVDRGDEPLIIDQPEGNLNNQSIVENLVPVFMRAKGRRQIIIVTHNPNIAVVCDAEQIVHCSMNAGDGFRLSYESGAIENPKFNKLSLDVLEGTAPAFRSREESYDDIGGA